MDRKENQSTELVESMIDHILSDELDVQDAVSLALDGEEEAEEMVETVELDESDVDCCPACGESHLEMFEGEDFDALHCPACDTAFIPWEDMAESYEDFDEYEEDEFEGMYEAEIDEEEPLCPACGSHHLVGDVFESDDGEQVPHLECEDCGTLMIPVDEEN